MRIANTVNDSIVDGPGLRFTIFTQGCVHNCPGCHNPETHDSGGGQEVSLQTLIAEMGKNPLLDGVTLSGGEPFLQAADCAAIAEEAHRLGLTVWVYTGYCYEQLQKEGDQDVQALLAATDVLVDGPYIEQLRSHGLPFRGSRNQRLIDLAQSRKTGEIVLWDKEDKLKQFSVPDS